MHFKNTRLSTNKNQGVNFQMRSERSMNFASSNRSFSYQAESSQNMIKS